VDARGTSAFRQIFVDRISQSTFAHVSTCQCFPYFSNSGDKEAVMIFNNYCFRYCIIPDYHIPDDVF